MTRASSTSGMGETGTSPGNNSSGEVIDLIHIIINKKNKERTKKERKKIK